MSDVGVREVLEGWQWMRDEGEAVELEEILRIAEKAENKGDHRESISDEKVPLIESEVINETSATPLPSFNESVPVASSKCENLSPLTLDCKKEACIVPKFGKKIKFCWHCRSKHSGNGFRCFLRTLWR